MNEPTWDRAYTREGAAAVSWHEASPQVSRSLIDGLRLAREAPIIDVGGGASRLVDCLLADGRTDLTVLDLSEAALRESWQRLGEANPVEWLHCDLLAWEPRRHYALWHDRAVLHFFVDPGQRAAYFAKLRVAVAGSGAVIIGAFAEDGPERCSGLPVTRYSISELTTLLGEEFTVVESRREVHVTPGGARQPFSWIAARRVQ